MARSEKCPNCGGTELVEIVYGMPGPKLVALYEKGMVHHVGVHTDLEDEQCSWVPGQGPSPNRMDALVWGVTACAKRATTMVEIA